MTALSSEFAALFANIRVILYHKHHVSARTLFLRHADGGVCAPEPLPMLAAILDDEDPSPGESALATHPASLALALCQYLGLSPDAIEVDTGFRARIDTPGQQLTAYLARFKSIDPPCAELASRGARFCAITELRGRPPAEMALLRQAYHEILGG